MGHNVAVHRNLILLLVVIVLTTCNRQKGPPPTEHVEMTAGEYEVLSQWIDNKFTTRKRGRGLDQVVIFDSTDSDDDRVLRDNNGQPVPWGKFADSLRAKASSLQQTTIDAYRKANSLPASVRPQLHLSIHCQILSLSQSEVIFGRGGGMWPAFYKQFPHSQGLLTFSRVGFSADGTQAFFYYGNQCEGLCGVGGYVIMQKQGNSWEVDREIAMWVS